jgi:NADPH:quinone reductase-like Zn-dependent oxidoreductase
LSAELITKEDRFMKAAVINARGQAPQFQEFPEPVAAEGEAIVQMRAAGLHPIVKSLASGEHYASGGQLPAIAGIDGVGDLNGRLVYCFSARRPYGTMAEQTVVNPEKCLPLPEGLDPMQAAAIANPGISAWLSLKLRAGLAAGENVLILGATGVAGLLAIQAARYLGAGKVIAAGRNLTVLQSQPVDAVISLTDPEEAISQAFASHLRDQGIDVVIDYLWGRTTELFLGALAKSFSPEATRRTRLIEVGAIAGNTISLPASTLRSVDLSIQGSGFGSVPLDQIMRSIPEFFSLAAQGHLSVVVESVPLSQVEQAWSAVEKGKRIVFSIDTR